MVAGAIRRRRAANPHHRTCCRRVERRAERRGFHPGGVVEPHSPGRLVADGRDRFRLYLLVLAMARSASMSPSFSIVPLTIAILFSLIAGHRQPARRNYSAFLPKTLSIWPIRWTFDKACRPNKRSIISGVDCAATRRRLDHLGNHLGNLKLILGEVDETPDGNRDIGNGPGARCGSGGRTDEHKSWNFGLRRVGGRRPDPRTETDFALHLHPGVRRARTYTGRIDEYGVALGAVEQGHLGGGVLAPVEGVPHGALAGTYAGVGGEATAGVAALAPMC